MCKKVEIFFVLFLCTNGRKRRIIDSQRKQTVYCVFVCMGMLCVLQFFFMSFYLVGQEWHAKGSTIYCFILHLHDTNFLVIHLYVHQVDKQIYFQNHPISIPVAVSGLSQLSSLYAFYLQLGVEKVIPTANEPNNSTICIHCHPFCIHDK